MFLDVRSLRLRRTHTLLLLRRLLIDASKFGDLSEYSCTSSPLKGHPDSPTFLIT